MASFRPIGIICGQAAQTKLPDAGPTRGPALAQTCGRRVRASSLFCSCGSRIENLNNGVIQPRFRLGARIGKIFRIALNRSPPGLSGVTRSGHRQATRPGRDGCALPQRLSRFPAAWSALSRRSLGDRERLHPGTPSPGNDSASQARSASVSVQEFEYRVRHLAELHVASAQLVGDVHGHVAGPALGGVEGNDADRIPILTIH